MGQTEVISGMMMSFACMAVVSIMWALITFSMAFGCVRAVRLRAAAVAQCCAGTAAAVTRSRGGAR